MRTPKWRKTMAWLLLAAYLPMLAASVVHMHHSPTAGSEECFDCAHHISHPAHFDKYQYSEQNCLYCHLLSLPGLTPEVTTVVILLTVALLGAPTVEAVALRTDGHSHSRAPPVTM